MKKSLSKSEMQAVDLLCLGNLVIDVYAKPIDKFPFAGGGEYFDELEIHPGGCAFNTGVDAARLGLKVCVNGKIGNDVFGDLLKTRLEKESIETSCIHCSANAGTGLSFVMVPENGQRRYYHTVGANADFNKSEVELSLLKQAKVFHVAGASLLPSIDGEPTVELLKFAHEHGLQTSLDPVVKERTEEMILPCLPHLDIFLPNNDESYLITGLEKPEDQLEFYLDRGVRTVGIKQGENGVLLSDGKQRIKMGVYPVPVIDTCGAGDAFIAGFLYSRLQGWDLMKTAGFATATAAFCVQSLGTTTGIPAAKTVLEFIAKNKEPEITEI